MFIARKQWAAAALAACMSAGAAWAEDHHSHHDQGYALTLNHGKKWATDDNLRLGMSRIRDALAAELPVIHSGKASAQQYLALAKKVNAQIEFMVQHCKLDKDADEMLHLILAEIIAGADAMSDQKGNAGAEKIHHALENYGTYFAHPGWHGLK